MERVFDSHGAGSAGIFEAQIYVAEPIIVTPPVDGQPPVIVPPPVNVSIFPQVYAFTIMRVAPIYATAPMSSAPINLIAELI